MSDSTSTDAAAAKEAAGRHAAGYVTDGMRVGLGTGSTVHFSKITEAGFSTKLTALRLTWLDRTLNISGIGTAFRNR